MDGRVRRLLIVGCPGAGKSTLAKRLGDVTRLPVIHLDDVYFGPCWGMRPQAAWTTFLTGMLARPAWIVDGNYANEFHVRLSRADEVVILDRSPVLCAMRYVRRLFSYMVSPYERLPHYMQRPNGTRTIAVRPLHFIGFILAFRSRTLPVMLNDLSLFPKLTVRRLRTQRDVETFVEEVAENGEP